MHDVVGGMKTLVEIKTILSPNNTEFQIFELGYLLFYAVEHFKFGCDDRKYDREVL